MASSDYLHLKFSSFFLVRQGVSSSCSQKPAARPHHSKLRATRDSGKQIYTQAQTRDGPAPHEAAGPDLNPAACEREALPVENPAAGAAAAAAEGDPDVWTWAEEGGTCLVCLDAAADAVLVECGHGGLCAGAATHAPSPQPRLPFVHVPFSRSCTFPRVRAFSRAHKRARPRAGCTWRARGPGGSLGRWRVGDTQLEKLSVLRTKC